MKKNLLGLLAALTLGSGAHAVDVFTEMPGLWRLASHQADGSVIMSDFLIEKTTLNQTNAMVPSPFYKVTGSNSRYMGLAVRQNPGSTTTLLTWSVYQQGVGSNVTIEREYNNISRNEGNQLTLADANGNVVATLTKRPDLIP